MCWHASSIITSTSHLLAISCGFSMIKRSVYFFRSMISSVVFLFISSCVVCNAATSFSFAATTWSFTWRNSSTFVFRFVASSCDYKYPSLSSFFLSANSLLDTHCMCTMGWVDSLLISTTTPCSCYKEEFTSSLPASIVVRGTWIFLARGYVLRVLAQRHSLVWSSQQHHK